MIVIFTIIELKKNSRIILSLDVLKKSHALDILNKTHDLIDAIKINQRLIFSNGIKICNEIKEEYDLPIIGDFKIADVPVTNRYIVDASFVNSIDFLTVHGFIGEDLLENLKQYADDRIQLIIITEFTSCVNKVFFDYKKFSKIALKLDFFGVQAPATKPYIIKEIRKIVGNNLKIFSCGVGTQGGKVGNAIKSGADYEIIGRSIYLSDNPRIMTERFKKMIDDVNV